MDVGSATFSGRIHYLRIICASACLSVWLSNHLSPICLIHHVFFTWLMSNSVLWSPDNKIWLIGKDPDARKDWGQEEKRAAEDEKAGWHHWLSAHEFEKSLENSAGQGSLVCCSPWGRKGSDTIWRLNKKVLSAEQMLLWKTEVQPGISDENFGVRNSFSSRIKRSSTHWG